MTQGIAYLAGHQVYFVPADFCKGKLYGFIVFIAEKEDAKTADEINTLQTLTNNISYAIMSATSTRQ
jgi:hypothetical protein